ncbi:MAG: transcription antitermination factor NusB [Candidatus Deianiraeaceae bacterium]
MLAVFMQSNNPFKSIKENIQRQVLPPEEMRARFEAFITNRKRITRLAFVQALFLFQHMKNNNEIDGKTPQQIGRNILATMVDFYKNIFYAERYGTTRKTQKLDEKFLHSVIQNTIESIPAIDTAIQRFLKSPWKIETLDNNVVAILRAGTYELLFNAKVQSKIITSEYTNLTHAFFDGHEIGFVNAILDKISHNV